MNERTNEWEGGKERGEGRREGGMKGVSDEFFPEGWWQSGF